MAVIIAQDGARRYGAALTGTPGQECDGSGYFYLKEAYAELDRRWFKIGGDAHGRPGGHRCNVSGLLL